MKLSQILLLCLLGLVLFSCIINIAICQEVDEEMDASIDATTTTGSSNNDASFEDSVPLEQQQPIGEETFSGFISSPDIVTSSILLSKDLALGEQVDVLLGLKNTGEGDEAVFNIQYARGYLFSTLEPSVIIQNFTGFQYNVTIGPNQSASLVYSLFASPQLEARDYVVAVEVFYLNANRDTFGSIAFNQTLDFAGKEESLFSIGSIIQMTMIIGMMTAVFYGAYIAFSGSKVAKKKVSASTTTSTGDQVSEDKLITVGKEKINMDFIPAAHRKKLEQLKKKKEAAATTATNNN